MKTSNLPDITRWFFETIQSLQAKQETVTIGLPGGTSLEGWYSELLTVLSTNNQSPITLGIDFKRVRFCLVDERCVPAGSPDRNDAHVWEKLISPLCKKEILQAEQFIHPGESVDAIEYSEQVGTIDIGIFGLGPDGHIASLFPHHPALECETEGFIRIHGAPKDPPERISLTPITVSEIEHACLFAVGGQKKVALANFLNEELSWQDCPAKLLQPDVIFDSTTN